jgi:hypothetical protein
MESDTSADELALDRDIASKRPKSTARESQTTSEFPTVQERHGRHDRVNTQSARQIDVPSTEPRRDHSRKSSRLLTQLHLEPFVSEVRSTRIIRKGLPGRVVLHEGQSKFDPNGRWKPAKKNEKDALFCADLQVYTFLTLTDPRVREYLLYPLTLFDLGPGMSTAYPALEGRNGSEALPRWQGRVMKTCSEVVEKGA